MEGNDRNHEAGPVITIMERRSQRQTDLSSEEVMTILRKRATLRKRSRGRPGGADGVE